MKQNNTVSSRAMTTKDEPTTDLSITESSHEHSLQPLPNSQSTISDLVGGTDEGDNLIGSSQQESVDLILQKKVESRKWSKKETLSFYIELQKVGPDFTSMSAREAFQGRRSKKQLRNKYRKEGRLHPKLMDHTLKLYFQQ